MKKSAKVTLTVVAAMGLTACSRRHPDPCEAANFDAVACGDAVRNGGYYWGGSWYRMSYHYPYPYYYDAYRTYVSRGGVVTAPPAGVYARPGASVSSPAGSSSHPGGVVRGGFGSTGAGHATGG